MDWTTIKSLAEADIELNGTFDKPVAQPVKLSAATWLKIVAVVEAAVVLEDEFYNDDDDIRAIAILAMTVIIVTALTHLYKLVSGG